MTTLLFLGLLALQSTPPAAGSNACSSSEDCKYFGLCEEGPDGCVLSKQGCLASQVCRAEGECFLVGGRCVATAESCAASSN